MTDVKKKRNTISYKKKYLRLKEALEKIHRETYSLLLKDEIDKVLGRPVIAGATLKKWMENASKAPKEEVKEEEKVE